MRGSRFRLLAALTVFTALAASVQVNAPSIGSGYGFIVVSTVLSLLLLPPRLAALVVLAGSLLSLPVVYAAKTSFMIVALLGAALRPPFTYIAGLARERYGPLPGVLAYAALDPLVVTTVAIAYYGDDGIHASLAVYDVVTALLTYLAYRAYEARGLAGLASGLLGVSAFIAGTWFFLSPPVALAGVAAAAASALAPPRLGGREVLAASAALIALASAAGWETLSLNLSVGLYPFKPSSYTEERWRVDDEPCGYMENALRGVYDPERLRIVHGCGVVEGVIESPPNLVADGDIVFDLRVEESSPSPVISLGSIVLRDGTIHVEIVPMDRGILEPLDYTLCVGDRVVVWGPIVVDTDHAQWSEVHPAIGIRLVERGEGPCVKFLVEGS